MKAEHDPETFLLCNTPRPIEEANASIDAFYEAVRAARKEHRIGNVYIVIETLVQTERGPEPARATSHIGDTSRSTELAAYALGFEAAAIGAVAASKRADDDEAAR